MTSSHQVDVLDSNDDDNTRWISPTPASSLLLWRDLSPSSPVAGIPILPNSPARSRATQGFGCFTYQKKRCFGQYDRHLALCPGPPDQSSENISPVESATRVSARPRCILTSFPHLLSRVLQGNFKRRRNKSSFLDDARRERRLRGHAPWHTQHSRTGGVFWVATPVLGLWLGALVSAVSMRIST